MIIYKTTNLVNGKIYIGQDSNDNPKYLGSGKILALAIKKYGTDNFKKEILERCISKEQLNVMEIYWIHKLDSMNSNVGYNISIGGHGGNLGPLVNKKISDSVSKLYTDPAYICNSKEFKQRLSDSQKGRVVSEDTRIKISNAQKGDKGHWYGKANTEHSILMKSKYKSGELTPWNKGIEYDIIYKKRLSDAHKGQVPWNKNKTNIYSDETKKKMSAAKKGIPRPGISEKLKQYYASNISSKCKSIIDTRSGKIYLKVKDLRADLEITEYTYKKLLSLNILIWN
jgi:group I intron endonuclease